MKLGAISKNLLVSAKLRLPYPWRGDSQGQETFSAASADKQTRNYAAECSNHHSYQLTLN